MTDSQTNVEPDRDGPSAAMPLDPQVLSMLLARLGMPVTPGAMEHAWRETGAQAQDAAPVRLVQQMLVALNRKQVQVAQMLWHRLDRRYLPAMVCHGGRWLIASADGENIILESADGARSTATPDALNDALVIWLRKPGAAPETRPLSKSPAVSLLLREMLKNKRWIADVAVATIVINLLAIATSMFSMQVYDRVVPTFAFATLGALVCGMGIITALDWVLKRIRAGLLDRMALRVDEAVSQQIFEHLLHLRQDTRPRSLGSLAAQVNGMESVRSFMSSTIVFSLTDLPFVLLYIALIAVLGGQVGWVYALLAPVALALAWFAQKRLSQLSHLEVRRSNERQGLLVDSIQGAETIQSLGAGWRFAEQWRAVTATLAGYQLKSKSITSSTISTTGALGTVAYVAAIAVGVKLIEAGDLTSGGLIASTMLGGRVIGPITQSVQLIMQWQNVREALSMVDKLLMHETGRREGQELLAPLHLADRLELENVRFSYENSPIVRINVPALQFNAGERVVILGTNGSGKSTLLKIAAGLYKPSQGQVRVGGADLWELDPAVLSERIAYLPQDVRLFKGTLRSNMALSGGISDASLLEAANLLGVDRIAADNPKSMDLEVSEGGEGMSGGQRQLVGLARVFLARPRIWLLDEPTASLDMESETRVVKAIESWIRPTDIVLIATHRPRLTSLATRVIIMQRGQIVADGTPDQVLKGMPARNRQPQSQPETEHA